MSKCKNCHHNCHCNGDFHADEYGICTCDNCKCKDKRIRGSFTLATGNTLVTALTSSASLGSVSISVS